MKRHIRLVWLGSVPAVVGFLIHLGGASPAAAAIELRADGYHVFPGDEIQEALQRAATNQQHKVVTVHAGEYRPSRKRQAMIWFNQLHDGIHLRAEGVVTLTAANAQLAMPADPGYPAVVNHIVYFGDGVSSNTVLTGFRLTGANNFVTKANTREIEPSRAILRNHFFFSDGGAIKVFGRSYPVLQHLEIVNNYSSPCGGGISVQHQGYRDDSVLIRHCRFFGNRAQGTGGAVDLLAGSAARIENCLFVGNSSNQGEDPVAKNSGERPFINNGVLTIFWRSRAWVRHCTFTGNRNGVDDMGGESVYLNNIFADNQLDTGLKGSPRYELAVNAGAQVAGCVLRGLIHDLQKCVSSTNNVLDAPPPAFTTNYVPTASVYGNAGYRPPLSVPR
jgi:hypothetical protein